MGAAASGKAIVVVDDHADIRSFMKAALKGAGYEVRTAKDGSQALGLMYERGADLLITDIFMPGIVISAGTILGLKHDFLSTAALLKVAATLRKPFTAEELFTCVRRVLPC